MGISNGVNKIEKFLFYLFLFSIPLQTRKILFLVLPAGGSDKFVEWTSGFLYFTDLLIVAVIFLAFLHGRIKFKKADIFLSSFFLIAGLSLLASQNISLSIYQWIKLAELLLLFLYIRANLGLLDINKILKIFVASGVFQAILAVAQFFNQNSLGLKYLEAGVYNANIPGVATFFVNGVKFIRAYGTTPHPNVLAVFLLVSIFCLYALWLNKSRRNYWLLITSYGLLLLGLFLTFSRAVILVFIAASLLFFLITLFKFKETRFKIIALFLLFIIYCLLFTGIFWPEFQARFAAISPEDQAVSLRVYYNDIALSSIKEKPLLGLGLGNFVWYLLNNYHFKEFWLYQPVHNLYLLIASEVGIVGLIVFLIFIAGILLKGFKLIRQQTTDSGQQILFTVYCLLFTFLALAMIDHYFWTIQQSRLIFWAILGITSGLSLWGPHSLTDKT